MEKINRKKIWSIVMVCIVAASFLLGIIFTIVKETQYDQAANYNNAQEDIDRYNEKLDKQNQSIPFTNISIEGWTRNLPTLPIADDKTKSWRKPIFSTPAIARSAVSIVRKIKHPFTAEIPPDKNLFVTNIPSPPRTFAKRKETKIPTKIEITT